MVWLILGLILFHGIHSLRMIAPDWRNAQYEAMGENKWKSVYSLVSIIALVILVYGYSQARLEAGFIYIPPQWGALVAIVLMAFAFILMTFNVRSSRFRKITKHPFLMAIILWSIAHLLANGDTASVLLFGTFLVWAIANYLFVSRRGDPLPPVAPLWQDLAAIIFGLILWVVFITFGHEWLFGVAPIA